MVVDRVGGRRSRAEQTEANRAAVLAAAFAVFRERGYVAATLDQIADFAGFSKGVVYSQFSNKADLFLNVLERRIVERAAENDAAIAGLATADPVEIVEKFVRLAGDSDAPWRLAVAEFRIAATRDGEPRDRYDALHARTVERLAAVLDQVYANAEVVPPVLSTDVAAFVLALDVGLVIEVASTANPIPAASIGALMHRLVFGA